MTKTNMARKLTVKELGVNAKEVAGTLAKDGDVKLVAYMVGTAAGYKTAPNKFDPTKDDVKFIGKFEGHNADTGEITVSQYAFLPGGADEMIRDALDMNEKNGGGDVEFAFSVSIVKDSSIAIGYKFRIAAASEPQQAHDVKNLFVVDAAPFVSQGDKNVTWTILASSMRTSEYIIEQVKANKI